MLGGKKGVQIDRLVREGILNQQESVHRELPGLSTRSKIGVIISAIRPSASPTTERHTTPIASRILYGLT